MSITDDRPSSDDGPTSAEMPSNGNPGEASKQASAAPWRRRPLQLTAGAVVLVAAAVITWAVTGSQDAPLPPASAPVTLPATLGGLPATQDDDFATSATWRAKAHGAAGTAAIAGHTYTSASMRRQIRVVVGRADLTGKLEFAWAADGGRAVDAAGGQARCTNDLKLTASMPARVRPTTLFCWRTSPRLSAYAFVVDVRDHPVDADGAKALDAVWKAALTGT